MVTIMTFILMMVRHPEILRKAQEESDAVTGGVALPSFTDRPNMPYLECVLKEVYRCASCQLCFSIRLADLSTDRVNPALPLGRFLKSFALCGTDWACDSKLYRTSVERRKPTAARPFQSRRWFSRTSGEQQNAFNAPQITRMKP